MPRRMQPRSSAAPRTRCRLQCIDRRASARIRGWLEQPPLGLEQSRHVRRHVTCQEVCGPPSTLTSHWVLPSKYANHKYANAGGAKLAPLLLTQQASTTARTAQLSGAATVSIQSWRRRYSPGKKLGPTYFPSWLYTAGVQQAHTGLP